MKDLLNFNLKFGHFIIFIFLIMFFIVILFNRFGFGREFGNFVLLISILIVVLQIFRLDVKKNKDFKKASFDGYAKVGWVGIIILVILIFRSVFLSGPAAWGDAPYIYPEVFSDFLSEPLVWESRGRLGIVNDLYWIYPLMIIYYGLGALFHLSNDVIIRLVFLFPAIFLALFSPWQFGQYFRFSKLVAMFSAAVYALSTYFILVIDGGQVGVALAYGLFPLVLLQLHKLRDKRTILQFIISLITFMLLLIVDVRFAVIAFLAFVFWVSLEHLKSINKINLQLVKIFFIFVLMVIVLCSYFLIPSFLLTPTTGSGIRSELELISILNPLLLFSPHWPLNEFGKITQPYWFFAIIPLLIFSNFLFKKAWQIYFLILIFLFFVLLAKGDSGWLGSTYAFGVDKIPLGGAFRDSTKFFAPVTLFGGILIGLFIENLLELFKNKTAKKIVFVTFFGYLILLLYPAISGKMHGVLQRREVPADLEVIADKISSENGFFRTVWFPDRHPLGFSSERKPALDAKMLTNLRPIESINVGDFDRFNFLHNKQFLEWMDIFGVRYLIFSDDTRKITFDKEKEQDWDRLLRLVGETDGLERLDWGTNIPIFQTKKNKPRVFAVDKVWAVIGGDDIYQKLLDSNNQNHLSNQGILFFEDGKFDPLSLEHVASESAVIIFNQKGKKDLVLSNLSKYFVAPQNSLSSEWALRGPNEYLKWKFELLVNKIDAHEFDYSRGIAFSSVPNEKLKFNLNVSSESDYILAIRQMVASQSGSLRMSFAGQTEEISPSMLGRFEWYTKEIKLNSGNYELILENSKGFQVVNVVALIPKIDWENSEKLTQNLLSKFKVENDVSKLAALSNWREINYKMISPIEYNIENLSPGLWLVFTDTYHPSWELLRGETLIKSNPFYSAINGFYIHKGGNYNLYFKEQRVAKIGLVISALSLLIIASILGWIYYGKKEEKQ